MKSDTCTCMVFKKSMCYIITFGVVICLLFTLQNAEFVWSKGFQSLLLSVYYIGSFVSLIPGGWMANRFGGKRLVTIPMLVSAVFTLLTPVLIRWNPYIVLVVRLLMGICSVSIHKSNQASRL